MKDFPPAAVHLMSQGLLERIQGVLEPGAVQFLVLKGPHLAYTVYDDPLERSWVDLDILVHPDDLERAVGLLAPCGIVPAPFTPGRAATSRAFYNLAMTSPLTLPVELHRALSGYGRYPLDPSELFAAKAPFRMGPLNLYGLGPVHLLLHLCIHMAKSYFQVERKHLADIQRLLSRASVDWDLFCRKAQTARCSIAAYYALSAARTVLDAGVPPSVTRRLTPPRLRKAWLDRHLRIDALPIYRYPAHSTAQRRARLALPLLDRLRDWPPQALGYARLRLTDRWTAARPSGSV